MTLGTPDRAPVPTSTDWPCLIPPDMKVPPPIGGALSIADKMVDRDDVRLWCVTTVSSNSTNPICASDGLTVKVETIVRATLSNVDL